ncbi:exo-alpha-sialidase [Candidatus Acetothermia bacterium]|nr:exo-alpha-sialidase [Candidatus Acetothermia bacterium]
MPSLSKLFRQILLLAVVVGISLVLSLASTGTQTISVSPNVKVIRDNNNVLCPAGAKPDPTFDCFHRQQAEPDIAVDPQDPTILVAGAFDSRMLPVIGVGWFGYHRSTDGGKTWANSFIPGFPGDTSPEGKASPLSDKGSNGDAVLAFDNLGNVFYGGLVFDRNNDYASVTVYSQHGAKYERTTLAFDITGFPDKPCMAVDTAGGKYNGNLYIGVTRFGTGATNRPTVAFTRSTDHGVTFAPLQTLTGVSPQGCAITVGPDGAVYFVWRLFSGGTDTIKFVKSIDGGQSFTTPSSVQDITPFDQARNNPNTFRSASFPTIAADQKGIYVAWHDGGSGKSRVVISCSSDGGQNWSTPVQVTGDAQNGHQVMPALKASNGKLRIAWYDSRNDPRFAPSAFIGEALDVYYAEALSGCPVSFPTSSVLVTDKSFNPNLRLYGGGTLPFIGDYIGITSDGTHTHIAWTDNRDVAPQPVTNPPCDPNRADTLNSGCRNQNIYMATVTSTP